MNLIDSDGRLFGWVNIIDFIVVCFLVLGLLVGVKIVFFSEKTPTYVVMQLCEGSVRDFPRLTNCGLVPYFVKDAVAPGDKISSFGRVVAEVTDVDVEDQKNFRKDILIQMRVMADEKSSGFRFMNQDLKVNAPVYIKAPKMDLVGTIIKISPQPTNISRYYEERDVELIVYNMKPESFAVLERGLKELDTSNRVIANIVDFQTVGSKDRASDVLIRARLLVKYFDGDFWFKNSRFMIMEPVEIQTPTLAIKGQLSRIDFSDTNKSAETHAARTSVNKTVSIMAYKQRPWIAEAIKVSDMEIDNKGVVLAEVLSKQVSDTEIEVTTETGDVYKRLSPLFKDINLSVRISAERDVGGNLIFHSKNLKVGSSVTLSMPLIDVTGTVTGIN